MTTLLVASTGGHLKELERLRPRLEGVEGPYTWVTFDTPQSRSALAGETVEHVRFVGGRDPGKVLLNTPTAYRILRRHRIDAIVSTGSAVALSFFGAGRSLGLPCHFIESAARSDGPSTSGKLMTRIPGVALYSQYPGWAAERWTYRGSVFDSFAPAEPVPPPPAIRRVVVSLGTYRGFPFLRLVKRLQALLPPDAEVLWQTGDTDTSSVGIQGVDTLPEHELTAAMEAADVIVAHAGVGTAVAALELGRLPILVPRRFHLGEHVDDHQPQIADELARRGLALSVDADDLTAEHLMDAAGRRTRTLDAPPPFPLVDAPSRRGQARRAAARSSTPA